MSPSPGTKNSLHLDSKGGGEGEKTEPYKNQTIIFALPFLKKKMQKYKDIQREQAQLAGCDGTPVH